MRLFLAAACVAAAVASAANAHHAGERYRAGNIAVSHVYTYENADAAHSMRVYLTVSNAGKAADRLVEASVPFADRIRFEAQTLDASGSLVTSALASITVAAGQTVTLQPGAVWIELEGVSETFEHGEHFDMELTFESAGTVSVEVEVEGAERDGEAREGDHAHDEAEGES